MRKDGQSTGHDEDPALRDRLDPEVFALPVERLRRGHYTDAYFNLTKAVLEHDESHPTVIMQVFQKQAGVVLGGMDEAIAILKLCSGCRAENDAGGEGSWTDGWPESDRPRAARW